jgi:hypothetical protein
MAGKRWLVLSSMVIMLGPAMVAAQSPTPVGKADADTTKSCDTKARESKLGWAEHPHSDLANVFHAERSDIADTFCRIWETTGADRRFKAGDFGRTLFTGDGVHPVVSSSLVAGSGLAGGANFSVGQNLSGRPLRLSEVVDARFSTNGSQSFSGRLDVLGSGNRDNNRHNNASIVVAHQHLAELTYFGQGNGSNAADKSVFALDRTSVGGVIETPLPKGFWVHGQLGGLWVEQSGVSGADAPSIDVRFSHTSGTPGLATSTGYLVSGGGLSWQYPLDAVTTGYAVEVAGTVRGYREMRDQPFSFALFDLAWTNRYTPSTTLGSFSLAALATFAALPSGNSVPFYLQPTLGGTDLNGVSVLRSFDDYRFRAPNRLAIVIEHEHEIAGPVGSLVFADMGQVSPDASKFDWGSFHDSFGVGITVRVGNVTVLRAVYAWGGGEGTRTTFIGSSDSFASSLRNRTLF